MRHFLCPVKNPAPAILALGMLVISTHARAQAGIGQADLVRKDVTHSGSVAAGPLAAGDDVFRNDNVKTGPDSSTRLVFLDQTNLALGPVSQVVLDKFVFSDQPSTQAVGIGLTKGVFRFATGTLDKRAYDIRTPVAAVGVRGTILDIKHANAVTVVTVVEGLAYVCPRTNSTIDLAERLDCVRASTGQTVSVGAQAGRIVARMVSTPFKFAQFCQSAGELCNQTRSVAAALPGDDALCGR